MKNSIQIFCSLLLCLIMGLSISSCVDKDFDEPPANPNLPNIEANTTIAQLKEKHVLGEFEEIEEDIIIEGVVVSDDEPGNFYRTLVIQDGTAGININITINDLYTDYPVGRKVFVKAKGLWLGDFNGLTQIGSGTFLDDGDLELARIEEAMVPDHIVKGPSDQEVTPTEVSINDLTTDLQDPYLSTLIKINDIQFALSDVGLPYATGGADPRSENRNMVDCNGNTIVLRNSGFADFVDEPMPDGMGSITAVYSVFGDTKQLLIRDLEDVQISGDRCGSTGQGGELMTIKEVRALFPAAVTAPQGRKVKGIVISDRANGNTTGRNLHIQDESGAGIVVRFMDPHSFALNEEIEVNVSGVELSEFNGLLQLNNVPLGNASSLGSGSITPNIITIEEILDDFENLESTLVTIEDVNISGGTVYDGGLTLDDGTEMIDLFTSGGASFANAPVPSGMVTITAIVSQYNDPQLVIRNLNDVDGGGIGPGGDEIIEDFEGSPDGQDLSIFGWQNIAVKGSRVWRGKEFDNNLYAQATAFGDMAPEMESWLITPPIDLSVLKVMKFETSYGFDVAGHEDGLSVLISTDFDGNDISTATWAPLNATLATFSDPEHAWISSGDIDLSVYSGTAYVAFKYVGNGNDQTTSFRIDNVMITKE